jgi:TPR repeat protein
MMIGIAHGLATLHNHGIVHGSLGVDIVFVDTLGTPKITGFHVMPHWDNGTLYPQGTLVDDVHDAGLLFWCIHRQSLVTLYPQDDSALGKLIYACCRDNKDCTTIQDVLTRLCEHTNTTLPKKPRSPKRPKLFTFETADTIQAWQDATMSAVVDRNDVLFALPFAHKLLTVDHPFAYNTLSLAYYYGRGLSCDIPYSNLLTLPAAFLGWRSAMHNVAFYYCDNNSKTTHPQPLVASFKWFKRASDMLFNNSISAVGSCYADGDGVDKDEKEALKYLEFACERESPVAHRVLSHRYAQGGSMVNKDVDKAIAYMERACELRDGPAVRYTVDMYLGKNNKRLYELCCECDARYTVDAAVLLGNFWRRAGDADQAIAYYTKAVGMGSGDACYHLGTLYEALGRQDKALTCFQQAVLYRYNHRNNDLNPIRLQTLGGMEDRVYKSIPPLQSLEWNHAAAYHLYGYLTDYDYLDTMHAYTSLQGSPMFNTVIDMQQHKMNMCRHVEGMINSTQYQYNLAPFTDQVMDLPQHPLVLNEILDVLDHSTYHATTILVEDQDIMTNRELEIFKGKIGDHAVHISVDEYQLVMDMYHTFGQVSVSILYAQACLEFLQLHGQGDGYYGHLLRFILEMDQMCKILHSH